MVVYIVLLLVLNGMQTSAFNLKISWPGTVTAGYNTTFTCSSNCYTNCTYTWSLMDREFHGSTLTWTPDGTYPSMTLQCTLRNYGVSTTTTTVLDIKNPVAVQTSPPDSIPFMNKSLDLICHIDEQQPLFSSARPVVWYKDGQQVVQDHMHLLHNNTLHFRSLLPYDSGFYQCETNLSNNRVLSLGYLLKLDTPWNVSISGDDFAFPGRLSTYTCLMTCILDVECTVRWSFESGFPLGSYVSVHRNQLSWIPIVPGTFQNFTCLVENVAAGLSAKATKIVEVKGIPVSGSSQLNGLSILMFGLSLVLVNY
ncbi:uncharacterized protein LOC144199883 [Stigmatopora nigra]